MFDDGTEIFIDDIIHIENDLDCLIEAMNSGVNVVATIHAKDLMQLKKKTSYLQKFSII